ncbi:MAG: hypothetical protein ACKO4T_09140 [Planctomycetaceae bacterium]
MNRSNRSAFLALLSAVVDATASDAQVEELARALHSDPEARRLYVRYMDMHAALTSGHPPCGAIRAQRVQWGLVVASLLAASILVALLALPAIRGGAGGDRAEPPGIAALTAAPAGYVATVASASADAVLDGKPAVAGARLNAREYHLTSGGVNIRFDGGARILLDGTVRFAIGSRRVMRIDEGTFVFQGDQTCESIEIVTPHSVFKNIGTRYAAVIDSQREEVHVAEGAVRRTTGDAREPKQHELIEAGAGRRYDLADADGESIPLDGALVTRSVEGGATDAPRSSPAALDDFRGGAALVRGLATGRGWIGPWDSRRGDLRVSAPGLLRGDSVAVIHDGTGKEQDDWKAAAHRTLEQPIDLASDGIWYLRFLVRRSPVPPRDDHRAMVVLRTRGLTAQEELDQGALIQIALRKHDGALLRVADTLTRASLPQTPGEAYAVVAKIVAGKSQPDQVLVSFMAAERLAGSAEPTEWSLVSEEVCSDLRLDRLSLEFSSGGRIAIGELCVGPTWESVATRESVAQPRDR